MLDNFDSFHMGILNTTQLQRKQIYLLTSPNAAYML